MQVKNEKGTVSPVGIAHPLQKIYENLSEFRMNWIKFGNPVKVYEKV